jgi:hypothetical protein
MNRSLINTLALLAILAAAKVNSAPLENETQERANNICGGVSSEFWEQWFIFQPPMARLICMQIRLTSISVWMVRLLDCVSLHNWLPPHRVRMPYGAAINWIATWLNSLRVQTTISILFTIDYL